METSKPSLVKQLGGAAIGIAIAVGVYAVVSYGSISNIQGYLVNGLTTANPDRVRVNDKNVDDQTLARIATRAKEVSTQMSSSSASAQVVHAAAVARPTSAMQNRATDRATQRALLKGEGAEPKPAASERMMLSESEVTPEPIGKNLPDSGPGLMFLVVITMAAALLRFRPDHAFARARK